MSDKQRSERENVVHLNPERRSQAEVVLTRLPAPMHSLRDKARQQLQVMLRELFDRADDALFELADKAGNNQEQNLYFDSMREVRIRRRSMEAAFFRSIDISFAQLLDYNAHREEQPAPDAEISLDDLSLVKNDELEELVAVEGMIHKVNEQYAEPIQHLTMRIDHLVPIKVYQKNNPLGADVICTAFAKASEGVRIDVKAKLVLFKLFDNLVVTKLDKFYQALNELLVDANILPSLKQSLKPKKPASRPQTEERYGAGASAEARGSRSSSRARDEYVAQHYGGGSYDDQTNEVLHTLRDLLGSRQGPVDEADLGGEVIQSQDLVALLSRAQQRELDYSGPASHQRSPTNLRESLKELLRDQQQQSLNQVDDDVINLVSMMFEFILDDRNLAAPMKVLLGRLQIPMVKVAIADKSFFGKGGHPARRLLNEMAMAALGWQEGGEENRRKDSLFNKMDGMVQTILSDFESDLSIFSRLLTDFRSYLEKETRRSQILEQRTLDAEDGKAKSERARAEVDAVLTKLTAGKALPPAADKLLREAWANVMFISCLKEGVDSTAWQHTVDIAKQLIWSALAPMNKDNRQRLLKLVPGLLQALKEGLESISFNPFNMTQLFKQLETLHLARLRGEPAQAPAPAPEAKAPVTEAAPAPSTQAPLAQAPLAKAPSTEAPAAQASAPAPEAKAVVPPAAPESAAAQAPTPVAVPAAAEPATPATEQAPTTAPRVEATAVQLEAGDQHLSLVGNITQGSWFEMLAEGGQKYRCRLAAIIKPTGKYIFVNRTGMKVAEETREGLALALKAGRLRVLDDGMLFDRALEAVIGNLRESRTAG